MKKYLGIFALLGVLGISACSAHNAGQAFLPSNTPLTSPLAQTPNNTQHYVYVSNNKRILVYPAGVPNPKPVKIINIGSDITSLAADSQGQIYAAIPYRNTIAVYKSGSLDLVKYIGLPTAGAALAFDSKDNLFITAPVSSVIYVIAKGSNNITQTIHYQGHFDVYGAIALDKNDNLFINFEVGGGMIQECTFPQYDMCTILRGIPQAYTGGLAFDKDDNLVVTSTNYLRAYQEKQGQWQPVYDKQFPVGDGLWFLTIDKAGDTYIPVLDKNVIVITHDNKQYKIGRLLGKPSSVVVI